ncbi:MAG: flagellar M-ring protein FliF [Candidatus Schekmanbacteria bacterium]|nr:flagellar M-ring protein FliF [Candidatus Schekmanbacteria bacterium]
MAEQNEENRVAERPIQTVLGLWEQMPWRAQVIVAVVALAGLTLTMAAVISHFHGYFQQASYQPIYRNLTPEDLSQMSQVLQQNAIDFRILPDERGIAVPREHVDQARVALSMQQLPASAGGTGFELFDSMRLGMTEGQERIARIRALAGELQRTIETFPEVSSARVHLTMPEERLFKEQEEKPKASIMLKFHPGHEINQSAVGGIRHLVASAIEGMRPEAVTVIDSSGRMLAGGEAEEGVGASQTQRELSRKVESELERKVINLLEPVVGSGKIRAEATVELDFTKTETQSETFDPERQVVRSEQRTEEKSQTGDEPVGGVPGVPSNVAGADPAAGGGGRSVTTQSRQKTQETINYEIAKTIERKVGSVGQISRVSLAVLVDDATVLNKDTGAAERKKREDAELDKLRNLVALALGLRLGRDGANGVDQLTVDNLSFDVSDQMQAEVAFREQQTRDFYTRWILVGAGVVAALALLLIVRRMMLWRAEAPQPLSAEARELEMKTVRELEQELKPHYLATELHEEPAESVAPDLERKRNMQRRAQMVKSFQEIAQRDPKRLTMLIKAWMTE